MGAAGASTATEGDLAFARPDEGTLVVRLAGAWRMHRGLPSADAVARELTSRPARRVAFDTGALSSWDSGLLTFLGQVIDLCKQRRIAADQDGLPAGVRRLLALAEAVPEKKDARREDTRAPWLARVGIAATGAAEEGAAILAFLGEVTLSFGRFITGRARYRTVDLFELIQQAGAQALPIVTLISFLVGTILAFVGAVELQQFGAQIYVANLVGIGMVRELGAMMTGIVMAGRTGAAFAAQLGSMKVTQEIEALSTMGISPLDFLVMPRMIALCLMMPLLCLYSNFIGMLGGAAIGVGMLRLPLRLYYDQTVSAVTLTDFFGGIFKASVYGVLIAIAGCLRGMQSGTSSSAVGDATTSAVVTGIVFIISACGIFAVVFWVLGI